MNSQILERYETANPVFVSKGENRRTVEGVLRDQGINIPIFTGRCLVASQDSKDWMLARDGDMVTCLQEMPMGLGFMGSDRFNELNDDQQQDLEFWPVTKTATRFALATTQDKADRFVEKVEQAEPIVIATTYPRGARKAIGDLSLRGYGVSDELVETVDIDGSVEAAPIVIPRVDAVFDLVDSGRTMRDNGLTIVYDRLGNLSVGAIWSK